MARPKKTPTVAVTFRISETDLENLNKMADKNGVPEMRPGALARHYLTRVSAGELPFPLRSVDSQDTSRK